MKKLDEAEVINKWVDLVRSRLNIIGYTKEAETGEEFTTCGDIELDNQVALILLNTIQEKLPNYGITNSEGKAHMGRIISPVAARKIQLLFSFLFSIDWASTAPGLSWPESYFVTYIPSLNLRIVTVSVDDDSLYGAGYSDIAIGFCRAIRTTEFGTKKIIQDWWKRSSGAELMPWESFWSAGLIDKARAEAWRDQVFGKRSDDW